MLIGTPVTKGMSPQIADEAVGLHIRRPDAINRTDSRDR